MAPRRFIWLTTPALAGGRHAHLKLPSIGPDLPGIGLGLHGVVVCLLSLVFGLLGLLVGLVGPFLCLLSTLVGLLGLVLRLLHQAQRTPIPADAVVENRANPAPSPEQCVIDAERAQTLRVLVAKLSVSIEATKLPGFSPVE